MAANARRSEKRSPLFIIEAVVVLLLVGVLAMKAQSWAGALSSYAVESSYYVNDLR